MAVGLFAAFQGLADVEAVIILVASVAGIGIGMAFRKAFPGSGIRMTATSYISRASTLLQQMPG